MIEAVPACTNVTRCSVTQYAWPIGRVLPLTVIDVMPRLARSVGTGAGAAGAGEVDPHAVSRIEKAAGIAQRIGPSADDVAAASYTQVTIAVSGEARDLVE